MHSLKDASKPAAHRFSAALFAALLVFLTVAAAAVAAPEEGEEGPAPPAPPQLIFEPDHFDFGLVPLNWGAQQEVFQLRNAGSEAIQVGSPQIGGPGASAFWTGGSNCYGAFLQPGEACYAQVYFGPQEAVEYVAQFSVSVGTESFAAGLSGTGGRATFAPDANPVDFGVAKVGSAGTTRQIEIANTGNMAGGMFIAVVAGGSIASFQILEESCTGVLLAPGDECSLRIRFQPVDEGVKKATLGLFGDNDGPTPIVLSGVGAPADPATAPAGAAPGAAASSSAPPAEAKQARRFRWPRNLRRAKWRRIAVRDARLAAKMR